MWSIAGLPLACLCTGLAADDVAGDAGERSAPGRVPEIRTVRVLDREAVERGVREGADYLMRSMHPRHHGVPRLYDPVSGSSGDRLHTTFSSSVVYALLGVHGLLGDEAALRHAIQGGAFLLDMQVKDAGSRRRGAFHYSLHIESGEKEERYVSGTAAKCIFALLALHQQTGDSAYLDAASSASAWLASLVRDDGTVTPHVRLKEGTWMRSTKRSLLYSGQALSALSRVHAATGDANSLAVAGRIAGHMLGRVGETGCYLGDDYRPPNPISSSWVLMSLLDYWRVTEDERCRDVLLECGPQLVARRWLDPSDPLNHGRLRGTYYTSGNGWIAEVLVELRDFAMAQEAGDGGLYRGAILDVFRWLQQFTYTAENTGRFAEPDRVVGGLIRSPYDASVRIDAVCHALNAYVGMLPHMGGDELPALPALD